MPTSPPFDRNLATHSAHLAAKRSRTASRASSVDRNRLSAIDEDGNSAATPLQPAPTHQPHHRPFSRRFLGEPPRYKDGREPPKYTLWDVTGPKGEKLEDLRNNAYVARRGGWKRICLVAMVAIVCIIVLVVGLVVGLRKKNKSVPPAPSPSPSSSPPTGPFPSGSYTFLTALSTTSTNCTSNPQSWTCEPKFTYSTSPTDSLATFNWIISSTSSINNDDPNFTISSTNNPFAIDFDNASLVLHDKGGENERYTFSTTVQKIVYPTLNTKCFYNDTQFAANLYTRKQKTYPSNSSPSSNPPAPSAPDGTSFSDWPFAVDATQSIGGGVDVPACFRTMNGAVGERVEDGYESQPVGSFCSCAYKNYDP